MNYQGARWPASDELGRHACKVEFIIEIKNDCEGTFCACMYGRFHDCKILHVSPLDSNTLKLTVMEVNMVLRLIHKSLARGKQDPNSVFLVHVMPLP